MSVGGAAWTVIAWLLLAALVGFVTAWLIQGWRMTDGRAAAQALLVELDHLRQAVAAAAESKDLASKSLHWKAEAARLGASERALLEERAHWQTEAMRLASAQQDSVSTRAELEAAQAELRNAATQHARLLAAAETEYQQRLSAAEARQLEQLSAEQALQAELLARAEQRRIVELAEMAAAPLPPDDHASSERELALLRAQLGASSDRILDLEQAINRLQLEALAQAHTHTSAQAELQAQLEASRTDARRPHSAVARPAAATEGDPDRPEQEVQARMERQRLQELEERVRRGRLQAQEHRAEVAGLKGRIADLEDRLRQLWDQSQGGPRC
jgi:hypothetical protein